MLGKLFKWEMKSTMRIFVPLFGVTLIFALFNKLAMLLFGSSSSPLAQIPQTLLMTAYVLLIVATFAMCVIVSVQRFYKNLLGQEGHLMFTLPVSASSNILAKGFASIVWFLSTVVVTLVSVLVVVPNYDWVGQIRDVLARSSDQAHALFGFGWGPLIALIAVFLFLTFLAFLLQLYTAVSFGQLSNSHKLAASFGAYVVIYMVTQTLSGVLMLCLASSFGSDILFGPANSIALTPLFGQFSLALLLSMSGLMAAISVGFFFVTRHLLGKKLNLE